MIGFIQILDTLEIIAAKLNPNAASRTEIAKEYITIGKIAEAKGNWKYAARQFSVALRIVATKEERSVLQEVCDRMNENAVRSDRITAAKKLGLNIPVQPQ